MPAAGYEIDFLARPRARPPQPGQGRGARSGRAAVAVRRGAPKLLRARGADVVMGGGGYVAGAGRARRARRGLPLVLTEADSHLGLTNRLLARARAPRLPRLPDRGPRRATSTCSPAARSRPRSARGRPRGRRATGSGSTRTTRCLLVFGGSLGRADDQRGRGRGLRPAGAPADAATSTSSTSPAAATTPALARAARRGAERYTLLEYEPDLGDALAACDLVLARSGGSVFELTAAGRPAILVPYPYATADHQHTNAGWMADAGAATRDRGRRARRRAARARGRAELLGDAGAARARWRPPRARSPSPTPPSGSPPRSCHDGAPDEPRASSGRQAALHRDRRRRDERPRAGLPRARRRGHRQRPRRVDLPASGCAPPGSSRAIGHDADAVPADAEVVVSTAIADDNPELVRARERGQRVHPPRRAARRALRREAADRRRRHPRQDDDHRDDRPRAARRRRRPGLLPRRRAAGRRARTAARQRRLGRERRGSSPRPTRATAASSARARGRGRHQRRARPPLALGRGAGAERGVRRLHRPRPRPCVRPAEPRLGRARGAGSVLGFAVAANGRSRPRRRTCGPPRSSRGRGRHRVHGRPRRRSGSSAVAAWRSPAATTSPTRRGARRAAQRAGELDPGLPPIEELLAGLAELPRDGAPARAQGRARRRPDLRRLRPPPDRGRRLARGAARASRTGA